MVGSSLNVISVVSVAQGRKITDRSMEWNEHARVNELDSFFVQCTIFCKLFGESPNLGFGWDFTRQQEPEHALGDNLFASWCGGQDLLTIWNGVSMKANSLVESSEWSVVKQ